MSFALNIGKVRSYFKGNRVAGDPVFGNCGLFLVTLGKQRAFIQVLRLLEPMLRHIPETAFSFFFRLRTGHANVFECTIVQSGEGAALAVQRQEIH